MQDTFTAGLVWIVWSYLCRNIENTTVDHWQRYQEVAWINQLKDTNLQNLSTLCTKEADQPIYWLGPNTTLSQCCLRAEVAFKCLFTGRFRQTCIGTLIKSRVEPQRQFYTEAAASAVYVFNALPLIKAAHSAINTPKASNIYSCESCTWRGSAGSPLCLNKTNGQRCDGWEESAARSLRLF